MEKLLSVLLVLALCCSVAFADPDPSLTVNKGLNSFIESMAATIPASSTTLGTWNSAYIGNLPHLGLGLTAGVTKLDFTGIKSAASGLGIGEVAEIPDDVIFPTYSADVILGGLIIPFDVSGFITYLPEGKASYKGVSYDNFSFGVKLRFPLLKENVILPGLSLGLGYSKNTGTLSAGDANTNLSVKYDTNVYSGEVQLSKSILILTPYIGARAIVSQTNNSFDWKFNDVTIGKGTYKTPTTTKLGLTGEYRLDTQVYGGVSLDFLVFSLSANGGYDFAGKLWTGSLAAHVKL